MGGWTRSDSDMQAWRNGISLMYESLISGPLFANASSISEISLRYTAGWDTIQ